LCLDQGRDFGHRVISFELYRWHVTNSRELSTKPTALPRDNEITFILPNVGYGVVRIRIAQLGSGGGGLA
jgi:hypothetical protein